MKIAYLILVHNTPNHTKEIINALRHKNALFFIHVDAKSTLTDYEILNGKTTDIIVFLVAHKEFKGFKTDIIQLDFCGVRN